MLRFDPSSSFAVLFGVFKYDEKDPPEDTFESFPWIENNIDELERLLLDKELFGFTPGNVRKIGNPTNGQIGSELERIRKTRSDIDTLFVYYCGHGDVDSGNYYLTGKDAGKATKAEKLQFEIFEEIFLRINAKRKFLILDACFSGRAISRHLADESKIIDVNVDRLAEGQMNRLKLDGHDNQKHIKAGDYENVRGIYVIASADRDKPAQAVGENTDFTPFTAILISRLKTGFVGVEQEHVTPNSVYKAIATDAKQFGISEPVKSDKFGLGDWPFIGNAAFFRRDKLSRLIEDARTEMRSELDSLERRLNSRILSVQESIKTVVSREMSLIPQIFLLQDSIEAAVSREMDALREENIETISREMKTFREHNQHHESQKLRPEAGSSIEPGFDSTQGRNLDLVWYTVSIFRSITDGLTASFRRFGFIIIPCFLIDILTLFRLISVSNTAVDPSNVGDVLWLNFFKYALISHGAIILIFAGFYAYFRGLALARIFLPFIWNSIFCLVLILGLTLMPPDELARTFRTSVQLDRNEQRSEQRSIAVVPTADGQFALEVGARQWNLEVSKSYDPGQDSEKLDKIIGYMKSRLWSVLSVKIFIRDEQERAWADGVVNQVYKYMLKNNYNQADSVKWHVEINPNVPQSIMFYIER